MKEKPDMLKAGLSRPLTAQEQAQWEAYLAQHPGEASEIEAELGLNRLLRELSDQPVSSNFTDQVIQAARASSLGTSRNWWSSLDWVRWKPSLRWVRPAIVSMLVLSSLLAWRQYEAQHRARAELAMSVAIISEATSVLTVDTLKDFDAIHQLSQVPVEVDVALLQALE